jgi:hypothetical protein
MAFSTPAEPVSESFLTRVCVAGGVLEVAVQGDLDDHSMPGLLEEIRHAAGLVEEVSEHGLYEAAPARRLSLNLTGTSHLEEQALDDLMALVRELEADDLTVGLVHR